MKLDVNQRGDAVYAAGNSGVVRLENKNGVFSLGNSIAAPRVSQIKVARSQNEIVFLQENLTNNILKLPPSMQSQERAAKGSKEESEGKLGLT